MKEQRKADVCLVMPPFADDTFPSLSLGLLSSCLKRNGISCYVDYAVTFFLKLAGKKINQRLTDLYMSYAAEAVFAPLAGIEPRFGLRELSKEIELSLSKDFRAEDTLDILYKAQNIAKTWLDETIERILSHEPRFVGVSSMFLQRNAALAILKKLKEKNPNIKTAMGGANCMGSAGGAILSHFPFVDYVFFGEGDEIIADVVKDAIEGNDFSLPYGVLKQGDPLPKDGNFPHRLTKNLDNLPFPDYDDFFESRKYALPEKVYDYSPLLYKADNPLLLSMEGSRGCWWGERHPCSFCGLNGMMSKYRAKSPRRIFDEMQALREKYGSYGICLTDSILSHEAQRELPKLMQHFKSPRGMDDKDKPHIFCEIKSNLNEDEVKNLSEIGFAMMQPGIESLSDHVLKLMGKGNTAIYHIALLKYMRQYGIFTIWNLLYGFPGEEKADYEELINILPLLSHLPPPNGLNPLVYHKNSVYAKNPEKYGLKLIPTKWYYFSSPNDEKYVEDIAYTFENENNDEMIAPFSELRAKLSALVRRWTLLAYGEFFSDRLEMKDKGNVIKIIDLRDCAISNFYILTGIEKEIYRKARAPILKKVLVDSLSNENEIDIESSINSLKEKKILIEIKEKILALAVAVD